MSSLLFGFTSGSIGFSLAGPAAGLVVGPVAAAAAAVVSEAAAGSVPGAATVVPSLLFFLCSPLRTSSANASLITSFLRSNLSAPCGVFLRHSSIRNLQRSE